MALSGPGGRMVSRCRGHARRIPRSSAATRPRGDAARGLGAVLVGVGAVEVQQPPLAHADGVEDVVGGQRVAVVVEA